ncbi:MAG TPA: histidine kinase [Candidatus Dormibacteraeota bacterium]|jgi:signal transduction histidine kinase|nr:histidine kinase [Candidatus Dormibacteraeota bacterium]HEX2679856.1 histidine kinase [Candidatus Dormibacteraeota bacterium]
MPLVAESRLEAPTEQAGVEEEVRRLVARELHDRVAQTLTGMLVEVENFKSEQVGWSDVVHQMDLIQSSTRQVLQNLRQLLYDLRGEELLQEGLVRALTTLAERFEESTGITTRLEVGVGWPDLLPAHTSLNLYRIVEEALANVRWHSGAKNAFVVLGSALDNQLAVRIIDDGRGLDADPERVVGLGTIGMRERALLLSGRLLVESDEGLGTTVSVVFRISELSPRETTAAQSMVMRIST